MCFPCFSPRFSHMFQTYAFFFGRFEMLKPQVCGKTRKGKACHKTEHGTSRLVSLMSFYWRMMESWDPKPPALVKAIRKVWSTLIQFFGFVLSGYVKIAIENGPFSYSGFTHWEWWFSVVFCMFTRGYMFARHVRPLRVFYTALPCALALLPASLSRVDHFLRMQ